ncbi:MAG: hypothetical protein K1Y36_20190 [Blastocatellia bacterium]|nr:hypothetical protein [Blastocatellia bacterium]
MTGNWSKRQFWIQIWLLVVSCGWCWAPVSAEQLPVKHFTSSDGLAQDRVKRIVRDQRGFLWICTSDGLSRFDGSQFVNYVPDLDRAQSMNDVLVTAQGEYWAATNGAGVLRLHFNGPPEVEPLTAVHRFRNQDQFYFTVYPQGEDPRSNRVNALFEDRNHIIWAGTDNGVFFLDRRNGQKAFTRLEYRIPAFTERPLPVWAFVEDTEGTLWIGTASGLIKRSANGRVEADWGNLGAQIGAVLTLVKDSAGRIWAGHRKGVFVFYPAGVPALPGVSWEPPPGPVEPPPRFQVPPDLGIGLWLSTANGLPHNLVSALYQATDGSFWISTRGGLVHWNQGKVRTYTTANGLIDYRVPAITEDQAGNLWLGSTLSGVLKWYQNGFTTFTEADGLGSIGVHSIFPNRAGQVCVITGVSSLFLNQFDGKRFHTVQPGTPDSLATHSVALRSPLMIEDHTGNMWVARNDGLYRFPPVEQVEKLATVTPLNIYQTKDHGLTDNKISRVFEDSKGDVWIASEDHDCLSRWNRTTGTFEHYSDKDGIPPWCSPICFREDRSGAIWIGTLEGRVLRYRNRRFEEWAGPLGLPAGQIMDLWVDRGGQLWIAINGGGLRCISDPTVARPQLKKLPSLTESRLKTVRCIVEDGFGTLYFGTNQGIFHFDPATEQITHYTTADGLVNGEVQAAFVDSSQVLWFGTSNGLSRLAPKPSLPATAPSIYLRQVVVGGVQIPLSALGATCVAAPPVAWNQNQVQIDFFGINFVSGNNLRYQYRLGGGETEWSSLIDQRTINFALAPGTYRFEVRAVGSNGRQSVAPAVLTLEILPPFWQRSWFLALLAGGLGGLAFGIHRYRMAQLIQLERLRIQIAADLHDDIGASLSQVAILSEVVRRQVEAENLAVVAQPLTRIAAISAEAMENMSDIVWSINPRKDRVKDLIRRMRQYAVESLSTSDIAFRFQAVESEAEIKLAPDVRRQLFLMFKECINNLVRHSNCTEAEINLRTKDDWVQVTVQDNGRGFALGEQREGNGLSNLRRRAESLRGRCEVTSGPGQGTLVAITVPRRLRARK